MHSNANTVQQVTTQLPGNTTKIWLLDLTQWSCVNLNTCEFPHKSPVRRKNKRISSELEYSVPHFSHGPSSLLCHHHVFLFVRFLSSSLFTCFLCFVLPPLVCSPSHLPTTRRHLSLPFRLPVSVCLPLPLAVGYVGHVAGQSSLISPSLILTQWYIWKRLQ